MRPYWDSNSAIVNVGMVMANSKVQRIRMHAKFLRITDNTDFPLNDIKKLILKLCPDGFRAWCRKEGRTSEYEKFRDAELRDSRDKSRGKDKVMRKHRRRANRNR